MSQRGGLWAQTARVVSAGRRLWGWVTYGQLRHIANLVQAWQVDPPVPAVLPRLLPDAGVLNQGVLGDGVLGEGGLENGVSDCTGPDGGSGDDHAGPDPVTRVEDAALLARLERVASQCEGREFGRFGYQGTAQQWAQDMAEPLVASEVAVAAGLAPAAARGGVDAAVAIFVEERLPGLSRLLEAGWVDWPKVRLFVWETSCLDAVVARAVDAVVLGPVPADAACLDVLDVLADPALPGSGVPVIARWTLAQLKAAIRAAIVELDAAEAATRAERARRQRHVRVREGADGTAELVADLPAEAAAAVFTSLTMAAKAAKAAGDPRTLDQLRADELVHRATRGVHPDEYQRADEPTDPGPQAGAESPVDDSRANTGTTTGAHSDTHSDTASDADSGVDPDTHSGTDPDIDSGADPGVDSGADPGAAARPGSPPGS